MQVHDGPQWMWKLTLQFLLIILDHIGKTEYRWIAGFKRSTQHRYARCHMRPCRAIFFLGFDSIKMKQV